MLVVAGCGPTYLDGTPSKPSSTDGAVDADPTDPGDDDTTPPGTTATSPTSPTDTGGGTPVFTADQPFPELDPMSIKSLQPDFWADHDEVSGNGAGGVVFNLVWATWEPAVTPPPCATGQEEYDGHCFTVDAAVDADVTDYDARGLNVTAVVYGVPAWARIADCVPAAPGFEVFCAPVTAADYGRFAGMLARRYDGDHGHGRISAFVIHNEINANTWFDVGCGQGVPCDQARWLDTYSDNWNAAYDAITANQPYARVLVSLDHHFGAAFDDPGGADPLLSGETVLRHLASRAAGRTWRVAFHPYPPNLLSPVFSPDDWPRVTYGNLGALAGWLHREFPGYPAASDIHLTEEGINGAPPQSSEAAQATALCDAMRNVLGTPGIDDHVYHRMVDHPVEVASGLALGLRNPDGSAKAAWTTWALANRDDLVPPQLSCGFEDLPYTRLVRSWSASRGHWSSTRRAPAGFTTEASWRLFRDEQPGSVLLFECAVGTGDLLTADPGCEGQQPLGPVGWAYTSEQPGTVALYRCVIGADHFVSGDPGCEGTTTESTLGWVVP
ncbi:MAG: DUF5722 domain-containing protein [Myxococcota bacterium]